MSGKELVVPLGVIGVLATMLLPVPPALMDFLLVGNLVLALILFLSTLYIPDTLRLSALPSMLLLATLYRLALNISTTRNVLSSGDGGRVVEAFGKVVVQGNLIVGLVIFLIITLVQFIVIAKGSERVAEVAARFTLDALPGKQMSIDADVRAGVLDFSSARGKRQDLQTESRFYGALDGAMKFVKGDAIAGLVITAINIVGGLTIGILIEKLEMTQAISKYTLLTVGDGLVAQIPALLNSLAAGIIVTRVARGDEASLAGELLSQLGQVRHVKFLCAGVCLVVSLFPGMPPIPFVALAAVLLGNALWTAPQRANEGDTLTTRFQPKPLALLAIEVDPASAALLHKAPRFIGIVDEVRDRIYTETGVILPFPEFGVNTTLNKELRVLIRGIPVVVAKVSDSVEDILRQLAASLQEGCHERLLEFVDDVLTRKTLDTFDPSAPELVSAVVPAMVSVTQLTEVLKGLVNEGVSIRSFEVILQAVAECGAKAGGARVLLEEVRIALRRVISHRYSSRDGVLTVATIEPLADLALSRSERERSRVDLRYVDTIAEFITAHPGDWVVLVSRSARRILGEFLNLKGLNKPVLAHEEIVSELRLESVGHITFEAVHDEAVGLEKIAA